MIDRNFISDNYIIRPIKIDEIDNYIKTLYLKNDARCYYVQKKFINWCYQSPFKEKFVKNNEFTIMASFKKKNQEIGGVVGFIGSVSFVGGKKFSTVWDIQYDNFSKAPGLALEVLKQVKINTEIYCGNNLNDRCLRSYIRVFSKKNFKSEVNRKIAIIDGINSDRLFNSEKSKNKSEFIMSNLANINKTEAKEIFDLSLVSEGYWEDHISRFPNTSDRRKEYLEWRFFKHPYIKYNFLSSENNGKRGFAIARIEKIKNSNFNALRILDLMPKKGFEEDLQNVVLNFARDNNCLFADFFCSYENTVDEICFKPFVNFETHKSFDIPFRLQPPEPIDKKSFNLFLNFNNKNERLIDKFYSTKTDGEMDLFSDQSGHGIVNLTRFNHI